MTLLDYGTRTDFTAELGRNEGVERWRGSIKKLVKVLTNVLASAFSPVKTHSATAGLYRGAGSVD